MGNYLLPLLSLLLASIIRTEPHPLDSHSHHSETLLRAPRLEISSPQDHFPGFTITQTLSGPYTEISPLPPRLRGGGAAQPHPQIHGETFPGFSILQGLAEAAPKAGVTRDGNKPDSYLFPYLFPGSTGFPGFSGALPPLPIPTGIARPLTPEEIASAISKHPWVTKEDLVKPIKEAMKPHPHHPSSISTSTSKASFFNISSPTPGKLSIIFKKPDLVTAELLDYLVDSLGQFQGLSATPQELGVQVPETEVKGPEQADKKPESSVEEEDVEINLEPSSKTGRGSSSSSSSGKDNNPTKIKSKSKPRPEYGIQQQKEESLAPNPQPHPLLGNLNIWNPLGSLVPDRWPSFTALIHRLFHDTQKKLQARKKSGRLDTDVDKCRSDKVRASPENLCLVKESCGSLCTEEGYSGGSCTQGAGGEHGACICHFDEGGRFGLLLKGQRMAEVSGKGEEEVVAVGCEEGCRSLGAYSGFCGGAGRDFCFCATPWHDGSKTAALP